MLKMNLFLSALSVLMLAQSGPVFAMSLNDLQKCESSSDTAKKADQAYQNLVSSSAFKSLIERSDSDRDTPLNTKLSALVATANSCEDASKLVATYFTDLLNRLNEIDKEVDAAIENPAPKSN